MADAKRTRALAAAALLWAVLFLCLLASMQRFIVIYDEGIILTGAARVLNGDVIHRDFYANYGPGQFYVVAGLFKLFGPSVLVLRLYDLAIRAATLVLAHGLLRRRYGRVIAYLGTLPSVVWMCAGTTYGYPVFPCLLLTLVGSAALLGRSHGSDRARLLLAGVAAGGVACFRYDIGAAVAAAYAVSLLLDARAEGRPWIHGALRDVALLAAGVAIVVLPLLLWLWAAGALGAAAADLAWQACYPRMRAQPFLDHVHLAKHPENAAVYLPPLVLVVAGAIAIASRRAPAPSERLSRHLWPLTLVFIAKAYVIPTVIHMAMALVTATMMAAAMTAVRTGRARVAAVVLTCVVWLAAAVGLVRAVAFIVEHPGITGVGWLAEVAGWRVRDDFQSPGCPPLDRLAPGMLSADYIRMAQLLKAVSRPDERVLVCNARHDSIWSNAVALYFLAERQPCTRWHHFDPGVHTTREVQRAMIADVEAAHLRWVLVDAREFRRQDNESSASSGVHDLNEYLLARYRMVAENCALSLWVAKSMDPAEVEACLARAADCR